MYSRFTLAQKYIRYYFTASNGRGHGIHSPFVYDFVIHVLNNKDKLYKSREIEQLRTALLYNNTPIEIEDFGAGSGVIKSKMRVIKKVAASSLKPKNYARLLARIAKYYKAQTLVELGTSFGISTAYIAAANPTATIYTLEGSNNISTIAQDNFEKARLQNIRLIKGDFDSTLPALLSHLTKIDFAFIDGNHRKLPTLQYFRWLLEKATDESVLVFDDIHWSPEMEEAWIQIQQHPAVTLTLDLFFIGVVFFNKDFKVPQHFVIRF